MEEEISLHEILDLLRDNWKFIVGLTVVAVLITGIFTVFFIAPKYSSSTTLIVGKPQGYSETGSSATYNDVLTNQKLVGTYSEIAKSESIMSKVASNLHLTYTDKQLAGMVEVTTVNDTELIEITVTSTDPQEAANIANETATVFMDNIAGLMKINNLQIVDAAKADNKPVSPNLKLNLAIAFLLGVVISVFSVFIKEMLNTTVKSVEELKNLVGDIPIVAVIPHASELSSEGEK
ncbi:YveK family protein [Eubacterium barkeri]|uniref:Capsular polysaccharide biosynthesis protein n=1 Tax=Eubacterium barkeri TaxID=1528 RepID=A0A1H3G8W0_EUBBA|nr:Wzz/FepE/Etk N-terminal domain-containing protein [Eubacterium barkeri]SDX99477.1 Capsular polysaccharide biosynthesis protein [Eubacterium barkeri]